MPFSLINLMIRRTVSDKTKIIHRGKSDIPTPKPVRKLRHLCFYDKNDEEKLLSLPSGRRGGERLTVAIALNCFKTSLSYAP